MVGGLAIHQAGAPPAGVVHALAHEAARGHVEVAHVVGGLTSAPGGSQPGQRVAAEPPPALGLAGGLGSTRVVLVGVLRVGRGRVGLGRGSRPAG